MKVYQHYKGGVYALIGEALQTETNEPLIIYQNIKGELFARPSEMFFGFVQDGDMMRKRFEQVFDDKTQRFFKDPLL